MDKKHKNKKINKFLTQKQMCAFLKTDVETLEVMEADKFLVSFNNKYGVKIYDISDAHKFLYSKYNTNANKISIIIPCYNEEKGLAACINSCLNQTRKPDQILVINDGSTDGSAEILACYGSRIDVITMPVSTGNKSFAQEKALEMVIGDIFVTTDGDTILDPRMLEEVEKSFTENLEIVAVGGYVKSLPYNWLTACRELDYIIGQDLHKVAQSNLNALFVVPGCAGAFKTEVFKKFIKFEHDTLTEDLDFTYKLHKNFFKIAYNTKAIAYTQDPGTLGQYINQMRRWYCGGWQNLRKHYGVLNKPTNALQLSLTYFEALIFSVALFILPLINIKFFEYFMIPYVLCLLALGVYAAIKRNRIELFIFAPAYLLLIFINSYIFLEQFVKEIVLNRNNMVWFHPDRRVN